MTGGTGGAGGAGGGGGAGAGPGRQFSTLSGDPHSWKSGAADGQGNELPLEGGQHWFPAHGVPEPGHIAGPPTEQVPADNSLDRPLA